MTDAARPARSWVPAQDPFEGGGQMGAALAAFDWAATALGPVENWPQSLRTTVNLCLSSGAPMMVVWGERHVQIYNDALAPLMGKKHPAALGRPYAESFHEVWDDVMAPLLAAVYERGEATYLENQPVSFDRRVPDEEMFWTFSWSPLRNERGQVVGALHPALETTGQVLAERRIRLLRDLAASLGEATDTRDACERAVRVLGDRGGLDVPVSAIYLVDDSAGFGPPATARLAASSTVDVPGGLFAPEIALAQAAQSDWLVQLASDGRDDVTGELRLEPALTAPESASSEVPVNRVVLPLFRPGHDHPIALLALGLSPRRPLDEAHRNFLHLVVGQLSSALTRASLHEQQYQVAVTLQRSLLPDISRGSLTLDIAARYLPGASETQVGGDWYDVIPLGDGRTALVIGDVMGRGVHAAAVMGQVRAAVRAYAQLDLAPDRVLELLDGLVEHIADARDIGQIVTCIYAVYDEGTAVLTLANAGHPPAILVGPDTCSLWEGPVGPPLGTSFGQYSTTSLPLDQATALLLYTDGLVERRDRDLDTGIKELMEVACVAGADDLEHLAEAALSAQGSDQEDDVALLAVRIPAHPDVRPDPRSTSQRR